MNHSKTHIAHIVKVKTQNEQAISKNIALFYYWKLRLSYSLILKMEAVSSFEISLNCYRRTLSYFPQARSFRGQSCKVKCKAITVTGRGGL
jgi:hypothetical protein